MISGLYLHVPFCAARCSYCAFATWTDRDDQQAAYFRALEREIEGRCAGLTLDTVYVGGGTPSRPHPASLASALDTLGRVADIVPEAEITLEANPESVDGRRAEAWLEAGFNRVSLGVQSFDPGVLAAAGRLHGPEGSAAAVQALRAAGFGNVSVDLIAGLPGEDEAVFDRSLQRALDLEPDHLSLYLLELEETGKTTPLAAAVRGGRARVASDDEMAARYERARTALEAAGLRAYEISNFARPGRESRHNLKYWRCEPVMACGVSAHWLQDGRRRHDLDGFEAWLAAVERTGDGEAPESRQAGECDLALERLFLGLRLVEGVDLDQLDARHPGSRQRFREALEAHAGNGLLRTDGARYALTVTGALLSNEVFADLV